MVEPQKKEQKLLFLIEHLEEFLYDWCLSEYKQIMNYLSYKTIQLVFTNYNKILNYKGEYKQKNQENIIKFNQYNKDYYNNEIILINNPLLTLIDSSQNNLIINQDLQIPLNQICLLDMKCKQYLCPQDNKQFQAFIFGGILGDNPPRDRTQSIRDQRFGQRQLGEIQLSTDTAILISKLILQNQIEFQNIPCIDHPEIKEKNNQGIQVSFQLDGFRYVSKGIDINTGQIIENKNKEIYMSDEIKNEMIFEDLDISKM